MSRSPAARVGRSDRVRTHRVHAVVGIVQWLAFLSVWAATWLALQIGAVTAWLALEELPLSLAGITALGARPVPTAIVLGTGFVQFGAMLALAGVLGGFRHLVAPVRRPTVEVTPHAWIAAIVGGVTVGWFPARLAALLRETWPALDLGAVDTVGGVLTHGTVTERVLLALLVAFVAPVVEELVFRGVLFRALEDWLPPGAVVAATTLLFCALHLDPAQAIPLLLTGTFLGVLRASTGAVAPCIGAHMLNNGLALSLGALGLTSESTAFASTTLVVAGAMAWWCARRTAPRWVTA